MKQPLKKPLKAPSKIPTSDQLSFPLYSSMKLDGIRCLINMPGSPSNLTSKSGKPTPNIQLRQKLSSLIAYAMDHSIVFDGELWSPKLTFQQIMSQVQSHDIPVDPTLNFYCFDYLTVKEWNNNTPTPFCVRLERLKKEKVPNLYKLEHTLLNSWEQVQEAANTEFDLGGEGIILRNPHGIYKHGRATLRENNLYKIKLFEDIDAKIVGFKAATEINDDVAIREKNEFGYSKNVIKKGERNTLEALGSFEVIDETGQEFNVGTGFNWLGGELDRALIWQNRQAYLNTWCTIRFQKCGTKDSPRIPTFIRFRDPK